MIPEHLVHDVRYIELRTRRRIRSMRAGTRASAVRGDGFDFEQHRRYRPGDDVRRIDWNATARAGSPFVREANAERDLEMVLAADLTRSMEFGAEGGRSKREALVLATASLLFAALGDRISSGVLGFTDKVLDWTAPVANADAAWTALRHVWDIQAPARRTLLEPVIQHLLETLRRTALIVLVSDFESDEDLAASPQLAILAARHDVVAIILEDPRESRLPDGSGFVRMRDLESGAEATVALTRKARALHQAHVQRRRIELRNAFYRCGVDHVYVDTQGDVVEPILGLFSGRRL